MLEIVVAVTVSVLGSQVVAAVISAWFNRRKAAADKQLTDAQADKIRSESERSETLWWKQRVEVMLEEMAKLQGEVNALKLAIDQIRTGYEQRIASLNDKIAHIAQELDRANKTLDSANETIQALRNTITQLRNEISSLLIKVAMSEEKEI